MSRPLVEPAFSTSGANVVEPSSGKKATGWLDNEIPPSEYFNWIHKISYDWIHYFASIIPDGAVPLKSSTDADALSLVNKLAKASLQAGSDPTVVGDYQLSDVFVNTRIMQALVTGQQLATATSAAWRAFAINPTGRIVAVGDGPTINTSDDLGRTWTARTVGSLPGPVAYDGNFQCATYAFGLFIIAGDASGGTNTASLQTSPDGITWTHRQALSGNAFRDFVLGGSTLLVHLFDGSSTHTTMTSTNGTAWSTTGGSQALRTTRNAGAYGAGLWVRGGVSTGVYSSPNGSTWTSRTFGSGDTMQVNEMSYDAAAGFLAYGFSGNDRIVQHSADGITWTRVRRDVGSAGANTGGMVSTTHGAFCLGDYSASVNRATMVIAANRTYSDSNADFFGPGVANTSWTLCVVGRTNVLLRGAGSGFVLRSTWVD